MGRALFPQTLWEQLFPQICQNSILGVPIENQCVKGGGLLYGGTVYFYNAAVSLVKLPLVIHSYVGVNQIFLQVMSFFKLESDDGCFQRKNIFRINLRDFPI